MGLPLLVATFLFYKFLNNTSWVVDGEGPRVFYVIGNKYFLFIFYSLFKKTCNQWLETLILPVCHCLRVFLLVTTVLTNMIRFLTLFLSSFFGAVSCQRFYENGGEMQLAHDAPLKPSMDLFAVGWAFIAAIILSLLDFLFQSCFRLK
jgi:hypothetical protein